MKPIPPKTAVQKRKLSVSLDQALLQEVDELAAFLGGATDRAYVVEQALRRIITEHKAFQRWRSSRGHAGG
jgi:metal-responsive CopG/Arc/MetJ family transcriptional regulator